MSVRFTTVDGHRVDDDCERGQRIDLEYVALT
jgi:hypothetical protein